MVVVGFLLLGAFHRYRETRGPQGPGESMRRWGTGCDCQMKCPEANRTMPSVLIEKAFKGLGLNRDQCVSRKPGDMYDGSSWWCPQV